MKKKTLEDQLFILGLISLIAGSLFLWFYFQILLPAEPFPPCLFHRLLGLYCPGCGGTRAVEALLHGQVLLSVWYHPLVLYCAVIFGGFMLSQAAARLSGYRYFRGLRFHNWYLYGAAAVVGINFAVKNCLLIFCHITL